MSGVRVPIGELAAGERALDAAAAKYATRVLRLREGDAFVAFDPSRALECDAVMTRVEAGVAIATLGAPRSAKVVAGAALVWIQGVAKGDKCDAIVRDMTELGATAFVATASARSVVKLDEKKSDARRARWERIAREAARQCGRGDAPTVDGPLSWSDALAKAPADGARFCLYEAATEPLAPPLFEALGGGRAIAFAVGPEGGLSDDEVAHAVHAGWTIASLGPFILRTETVAAAVLGAVRVWSAAR